MQSWAVSQEWDDQIQPTILSEPTDARTAICRAVGCLLRVAIGLPVLPLPAKPRAPLLNPRRANQAAGANRSGLDLFATGKMNLKAEELGTIRDDCFENPSTFGRICNGVLLEESVYEIGRFHTATIPREHHARPCPALCATCTPHRPYG